MFNALLRRTPLTLGDKILIGNVLLTSALLASIITYMLSAYLSTYRDEITLRSQTLIDVSAASISEALISYDLATLDAFASTLLAADDVLFVRILDSTNDVLVSIDKNNLLQEKKFLDHNHLETHNDGVFDVQKNISIDNQVYGRLELGIDTRHITEKSQSLIYKTLISGIIGILIISLIARWYIRIFSRRLNLLLDLLHGLVQDKANFKTSLDVDGEDEVAQIAMMFDMFIYKLKHMVDEIIFMAEGLSNSSIRAQDITANTSSSIEQQVNAIASFTQSIDQLANTI